MYECVHVCTCTHQNCPRSTAVSTISTKTSFLKKNPTMLPKLFLISSLIFGEPPREDKSTMVRRSPRLPWSVPTRAASCTDYSWVQGPEPMKGNNRRLLLTINGAWLQVFKCKWRLQPFKLQHSYSAVSGVVREQNAMGGIQKMNFFGLQDWLGKADGMLSFGNLLVR